MGSSAFSLPIDARGLYREMLSQAWRRGARLPNDPDQVRRLTGVTMREWKKVWPAVRKYWRVVGDSLVNDTQLEVYADAKARVEVASSRGKKGAQARAQALARARAQALLEQISGNAQAPAQAVPELQPPSLTPSLEEPPVAPLAGGRLKRREREIAERIRNNRCGCYHEPIHLNAEACIVAIVHELREKARAS